MEETYDEVFDRCAKRLTTMRAINSDLSQIDRFLSLVKQNQEDIQVLRKLTIEAIERTKGIV